MIPGRLAEFRDVVEPVTRLCVLCHEIDVNGVR
jgi:hypothetical protein